MEAWQHEKGQRLLVVSGRSCVRDRAAEVTLPSSQYPCEKIMSARLCGGNVSGRGRCRPDSSPGSPVQPPLAAMSMGPRGFNGIRALVLAAGGVAGAHHGRNGARARRLPPAAAPLLGRADR